MPKHTELIFVYLETGTKKVFAGAIDWPGWCRSGRDEASALESLLDYAPRYASVLQAAQIDFQPLDSPAGMEIIERLKGGTATDFGAPEIAPSADDRPLDEAELRRCQALLAACWAAFDRGAAAAAGKELRKGPRGGGRELDEIVAHVQDAEVAYLSRLGMKHTPDPAASPEDQAALFRKAILDHLAAAARGETPKEGPRGGKIWSPRYFVRRAAWHVLDHLWEIEDRQ